tara:strand:- start:205 stop:411 length:207 start_codon:yes stop_codon:yes gene_type:complete
MGIIFRIGNNNSGNSAVTEIETASVTHQITIQRATAITASAFSEISTFGKKNEYKKDNRACEQAYFTT